MIGQFVMAMVFIGLLQVLAQWALASRWTKTAVLFGVLGIGYWLALLVVGNTPASLLHTMPVAAGVALGVLLVTWLIMMQRHRWPAVQS